MALVLRPAACLCGGGGPALGSGRHGWTGQESMAMGPERGSKKRRARVGGRLILAGAVITAPVVIRRAILSSTFYPSPSYAHYLCRFTPQSLLRPTIEKWRYGPWEGGEGRHVCQASMQSRGEDEDEDADEEDEMDFNVENDRMDKFALDEDGLDRFGIPGDAVMDSPIQEPDYHTYTDPVTGEPSPTYGTRNPLPNSAFWGEDLEQIQKSSPTFARGEGSGRSSSMIPELRGEALEEDDAGPPFTETEMPSGARRKAGGRGRQKRNSLSMDDFDPVQSLNERTLEGEENRADYNRAMAKANGGQAKKKIGDVDEEQEDEEEEVEDLSLGTLLGLNGNRGYPLVSPDAAITDEESGELEKPLSNNELWWNWKKPAPDEKPWSAWQKRAGNSDTVMAAAMAETGQIKIFGEKPSVAESTLARARRRVFYNERMDAEEERKKRIGSLAYYKEWVKGYKKDTSKKAVESHYQDTGEEEGIQLLDMFAHQTAEEYRVMQGTDVRVRRDPLTMRMRPEQIKQVWGGDPVYPTINYVQDPNEVVDYRNENMHEPIPDIVEMLRENGRLLTQDEVKEMLELETIEENELTEVRGVSAVRDIGDEDDDDEEDEDDIELKVIDEIDFDGRTTDEG